MVTYLRESMCRVHKMMFSIQNVTISDIAYHFQMAFIRNVYLLTAPPSSSFMQLMINAACKLVYRWCRHSAEGKRCNQTG